MTLKIYLLGQFKIEADGQAVELPSRPAQTLLAYLALNPGLEHRREKLATMLWPEASEANGRGYLRQALWRLRKALESGSSSWESYLQINDLEVAFNGAANCWLDVDQLLEAQEAQTVEDLRAVVRLYRGELLPGFYEEWVVVERERLQSAYHQKINLLLERLIQTGAWEEAIDWAEQWIRVSYAPEPAFRILMRAHAGRGDLGAVSATYQRCVAALKRELGVGAAPETQRLYEQIRDARLVEGGDSRHTAEQAVAARPGDQAGAGAPSFDQVPVEVERPVFVARESELGQLDKTLSLALNGKGCMVFVTGEVGSGKTALVQEFSRRALATHTELVIANGNCSAYTGLGDPYLPFREILGLLTGDVEARLAAGAISGQYARRLWNTLPLAAQAIAELGPDLVDTFISGSALLERVKRCAPRQAEWSVDLKETLEKELTAISRAASAQSDLFEQYTRLLQAVSRKIALMVWVDDLQWADRGSISLLFHLGRRLAGSHILLVGSYRPEEVAIGRDGERHPLAAVVNELQRDSGAMTVNLDEIENRKFMEAFLDSEPNHLEAAFRDMLYRQTGGHPLFTIELLRGLQERGDLVKDAQGAWIQAAGLDWELLPARVEAVIAERIERLPAGLQAALQVASVEGELFTAEVVARTRGSDPQAMLSCLSGELDRKHHLLSAQSILRVGGEFLSRYRFRHILFQKYLYSSLDEVERAYLHQRVGTVLEELYGAPEQVELIAPQLALHFQEAGLTEKAVHYLHLAGERALNLSAYREAIDQMTTGLNRLLTLPASAGRTQKELDLRVSLGLAYKVFSASPEGERQLHKARELCQQLGKKHQLCQVVGELSIHAFVRANYREARQLAEEAVQLALEIGDEMLLAVSRWHLGFVLFGVGDFSGVDEILQQVIRFYDPGRHHQAFLRMRGVDAGVSSLGYHASCLWCLGYPDQAERRSQQAIALANELGHIFSLADVLCYGGCMLNEMNGDTLALKAHSQALLQVMETVGVKSFKGTGACYLGVALIRLGMLQEGQESLREGMEIRREKEVRCSFLGILGALAVMKAKTDGPTAGLAALQDAFDQMEDTGERFYEAELFRLKAEMQAMLGDAGAAEDSLHRAIQVARNQQAKSWELRATIDLARHWQAQGRVEAARQALGEIYGWFREGFETPDLKAARQLLRELGNPL